MMPPSTKIKKAKRSHRVYSAEFRKNALDFINRGYSNVWLCRACNIPKSTLATWLMREKQEQMASAHLRQSSTQTLIEVAPRAEGPALPTYKQLGIGVLWILGLVFSWFAGVSIAVVSMDGLQALKTFYKLLWTYILKLLN